MVSDTRILGMGLDGFSFEAASAMEAQPDGLMSQLQEGRDLPHQRVEAQIILASKAVDQVRRAHEQPLASVVPDWAAREVFDDMLHKDTDVAWAKSVLFNAPVGWMTAAHELFDRRSLADVVWDEESEHIDESYDLLQCLAHGDYTVTVKSCTDDLLTEESGTILSNLGMNSVTEVFNIMPSEDKATTQPKQMAFLALQEHAKETVDEILPHEMTVWDEEVLSDVNILGSLLQKLAMGTEDLTEEKVKLSVKIADAGLFEEISDKGSVWDDEMPFSLDAQDGLLQQLALGRECMDDQNTKPNVEISACVVVTQSGGSSPDWGMEISDQVFIKTPNSVTEEQTLVGFEQLYQKPPVDAARQGVNITSNSQFNKWFASCGEFMEPMDRHTVRPQVAKVELTITGKDVGCAQLVLCDIMSWEQLSWQRDAGSHGHLRVLNSCLVLNQLPSWQQGGFSPGNFEQLGMDEMLWDPGILMRSSE
ncbi:hypothetical protein C2845_PM07G11880 [Panicum miliaceum]|uniref:Uncharacterized protein n=1 Tax=Panicum miliaceum TaxID=4540 RepID=A0A3L6SNE5_PANMI|nr:hypothetical protein C2845_PM07G11880 [Panicum miliaceum]